MKMIPSMESTVVYSPFDLEDFITVRNLEIISLVLMIKRAIGQIIFDSEPILSN